MKNIDNVFYFISGNKYEILSVSFVDFNIVHNSVYSWKPGPWFSMSTFTK